MKKTVVLFIEPNYNGAIIDRTNFLTNKYRNKIKRYKDGEVAIENATFYIRSTTTPLSAFAGMRYDWLVIHPDAKLTSEQYSYIMPGQTPSPIDG
jgi:hypothetical protein